LNIKITINHLPTGKPIYHSLGGVDEEVLPRLEEILERAAGQELKYLQLTNADGHKVYIPQKLLSESTIVLEVE
jgi:hypothetical protein